MKKLALALLLLASPAWAQSSIPNHSVPVGVGPGVKGWRAIGPACTNGQAIVCGSNGTTDPTWGTVSIGSLALLDGHIYVGNAANIATDNALTGDCSISNTGVITCNNIPLTSGHIFVGSAGNVSTGVAMSQDCTITNAGVITCSKTNNVAFAASATTDTTNATNISSGTLAKARMDAFGSGDVSCLTAGGACTIAATVVTNAKLAAVAAHTLKANITAGAAVPADSTLTAILDAELGATQGQIAYRNATVWTVLAPGTSGQLLASGGAGADLSWATASGTGTVTSVIVAAGTGIAVTGTCTITATGTCTVALSVTYASNYLGADVNLNNIATYFDGPSTNCGSACTTGVWYASATVTLTDTSSAANMRCKLWDGTTVISSVAQIVNVANGTFSAHISGVFPTAAGNIKVSCIDTTATTGKILFNASGNSKDSGITVMRIG